MCMHIKFPPLVVVTFTENLKFIYAAKLTSEHRTNSSPKRERLEKDSKNIGAYASVLIYMQMFKI